MSSGVESGALPNLERRGHLKQIYHYRQLAKRRSCECKCVKRLMEGEYERLKGQIVLRRVTLLDNKSYTGQYITVKKSTTPVSRLFLINVQGQSCFH